MNWAEIVVGVLFLAWPLAYVHQLDRIHNRIVARGDDPARFDRAMTRPSFRATLWILPVFGVIAIVAGLTAG
ncbi:MAG: hypothetical protein JWQ18_2134 [Conexibacter sp.]|nr:hypothetical protein [Conexibacter sp.]